MHHQPNSFYDCRKESCVFDEVSVETEADNTSLIVYTLILNNNNHNSY